MIEETKTKRAKTGGRPPVVLTGALGDLAAKLGGSAELADALGVTVQTIARWNDGRIGISKPTAKLVLALAAAHGTSSPRFAMDAAK